VLGIYLDRGSGGRETERGRRTGVGDLCHKPVLETAERCTHGPCGRWKVHRGGQAGDVRAPSGVNGDAEPFFISGAPEVGGVHQTRAGRIQLNDIGICYDGEGHKDGADGRRRVRRTGFSGRVDALVADDGDHIDLVLLASATVTVDYVRGG